jgi:hypothetical protein
MKVLRQSPKHIHDVWENLLFAIRIMKEHSSLPSAFMKKLVGL